jgi:hypothetical protein
MERASVETVARDGNCLFWGSATCCNRDHSK